MEIKPLTHSHCPNQTKEPSSSRVAELLKDVDVQKVDAMFKESLESSAAQNARQKHPLPPKKTSEDCRWDQWGRT